MSKFFCFDCTDRNCLPNLLRIHRMAIQLGICRGQHRTFLRHIRVNSVDELKARILKGIDEFNASPVVFRWNKFDLGVV